MKKDKELKLWVVHFSAESENGDNDYETFWSSKEPTEEQLLSWWGKETGDPDGAEYVFVRSIIEVDISGAFVLEDTGVL